MPLLTLSGVSQAYGHVPLLDHLDLVIERGDRLGLIGRNGTGKSTLMRVVAGQQAPDDGVLWRSPEARIAWVPQEPELAPGSTVFEAVAEGLGALGRQEGIAVWATALIVGEAPAAKENQQ